MTNPAVPREPFDDARLVKDLIKACETGDLPLVKVLMRRVSRISLKRAHRPPLFSAVKEGHFEVMLALVKEFNCDPMYVSDRGHTLVHVACARGHSNLARYLTNEYGVDPTQANHDGTTPLVSACNNGHAQSVTLLVDDLGCSPHTLSENGKSLLHVACRNGHIHIVRLLVERYRLDPQARDIYGGTPLHVASSKGHLKIISYLIDELSCPVEVFDHSSTTPLHIACRNGQVNAVQLLVDTYKCSLQTIDNYGFKPFHSACKYGRIDVIRFLLSRDCLANCPTIAGDSPLALVPDQDSATLLIQHGARTEGMNLSFLARYREAEPLASPAHLLVIGHEGSGKSTIVKALQTPVRHSTFSRFFTTPDRVQAVSARTAGIVPISFDSPEFGKLMIFDFAGQYDYHPSHAAVLEHSHVHTGSAPLFLLLINLTEPLVINERRVNYWVNFVENNPIPGSKHPHAIALASHMDELKSSLPREAPAIISSLENSTRKRFRKSSITLDGFFALDCREVSSDAHAALRKQLKYSCQELRSTLQVDACCHVLMVMLLEKFQGKVYCTIEQVSEKVKGSTYPLSCDPQRLCKLAQELSSRTKMLFIRNKSSPEKSWILLQMEVFLTKIHGRIFAPREFHRSLEASEAGVVQWSRIKEHFSEFQDPDPDLIVAFLGNIEECKVIDDPEVLMLIDSARSDINRDAARTVGEFPLCQGLISPDSSAGHGTVECATDGIGSTSTSDDTEEPDPSDASEEPVSSTPPLSDKFLFIPGLITADYPSGPVWAQGDDYTLHLGWCLQCCNNKFFKPRFLQALLLRLTFGFAVNTQSRGSISRPTSLCLPRRSKEFTLWKNGLRWLNLDGVEVVLEFIEDRAAVVLLMRAKKLGKMSCVRLRSALVQKILETKADYCPQFEVNECLLDPRQLETSTGYPVLKKPLCHIKQYDVFTVAEAFVGKSPYVVDTCREYHQSLDALIYFDPYYGIPQYILEEIYSGQQKELEQNLLLDFSLYHLENHTQLQDVLLSQYKFPFTTGRENPTFDVLLRYSETDRKTVAGFRADLDSHSLFAGRSILEIQAAPSSPIELTGKHSY